MQKQNKTKNAQGKKKKATASATTKQGAFRALQLVSQPLPASYARPQQRRSQAMIRQSGKDGKITVTNEEYVLDISGTAAFTPHLLSINPGMPSVFPWLCNLAANYEFYHFKRLEFIYRPYVGTSKAGSFMMAIDYDVLDEAPTTKAKMMTYQNNTNGPVYQNLVTRATISNLSKFGVQKFVRTTAYPANSDGKTYDVGSLVYATDNAEQAGGVGMLMVSYEVDLMTPHSPSVTPYDWSGKVAGTGTKDLPFSAAVASNADPLRSVVALEDYTHLRFPNPGEYLVDMTHTGTGLTAAIASDLLNMAGLPNTSAELTGLGYTNYVKGDGTAMTTSGVLKTKVKDLVIQYMIPPAWTSMASSAIRVSPYKSSLL